MPSRVLGMLALAAVLLCGQVQHSGSKAHRAGEPARAPEFSHSTDLSPIPGRPGTGTALENEALPFTDYRMGAEDLISIVVLDSPEFSRQVRVTAAGTIRLPLVKRAIEAEGKTGAELEREIARALVEEGLLREPVVSVTVREFHSKPVSVSGAVRLPTVFQAARPLTLLEALARAGGLLESAGREVLVSIPERNGRSAEVVRIPLHGVLDLSDPSANMMLHGGEEVRVPPAGRVYVIGGVQRPGAVLLTEEQPLTLLRALALSGGTTASASSKALLIRAAAEGTQKQEIALNMKKLMKLEEPDLPLRADDVVFIPDSRAKRITEAGLGAAVNSFLYTAAGVLLWR